MAVYLFVAVTYSIWMIQWLIQRGRIMYAAVSLHTNPDFIREFNA